MASLNPLTRELVFKIVFYGPGLGGKTTTLQYIHATTKPEHRGKMVSLATPTDRTLYFDFLPLRVPRVRGMSVRLQLFTVPGQVYYSATRKLVLSGADGVVFVADSQGGRLDANQESLEDLNANLVDHNRALTQIPHTFHWNKRDLSDLVPLDELDARFNVHRAPSLGTVATRGDGVFEGLERITRLVLRHYESELPKHEQPAMGLQSVGGGEISIAEAIRGLAEAPLVSKVTPVHGMPAVRPENGHAVAAAKEAPRPASATATLSPAPFVPEPSPPVAPAPPLAPENRTYSPLQPARTPQGSSSAERAAQVAQTIPPFATAAPPRTLMSDSSPSPALPMPFSPPPQIETPAPPPPIETPAPPALDTSAPVPLPIETPAPIAAPVPAAFGESIAPAFMPAGPVAAPAGSAAAPVPPIPPAPAGEPALPAGAAAPAEATAPGTPTIAPPPGTSNFSMSDMWPEPEREGVRQAETLIGARDAHGAVLACDLLLTRLLASAAGLAGSADAPRDPGLVSMLLGLDGRRYLAFRAAVRAARQKEEVALRDALECFTFVLETRRARDLIRR